jgi:hypothetical protein
MPRIVFCPSCENAYWEDRISCKCPPEVWEPVKRRLAELKAQEKEPKS